MESRLDDLQKEHESLSEAHNSLEQLNSNWSEQNMEQRTKIETMVKEVHDLTMRLAQAEESIKSQEETNEELKNTYSNEVLLFLSINYMGVNRFADRRLWPLNAPGLHFFYNTLSGFADFQNTVDRGFVENLGADSGLFVSERL